jgi:hypothetical protein
LLQRNGHISLKIFRHAFNTVPEIIKMEDNVKEFDRSQKGKAADVSSIAVK